MEKIKKLFIAEETEEEKKLKEIFGKMENILNDIMEELEKEKKEIERVLKILEEEK
ncbi:MAG: hypothetical protein ACP5HH_07310 [Fervidicoccaceae archaeon]